MTDLPIVKFSDVAELAGGYAFKSEQYKTSGHFVLRTLNIRDDYSITRDNGVFISKHEASSFSRFALREHDTLFVMVGATLGKIGYVRTQDLPALLNQNMWVIRALPNKIDPIFLHYCFREISKIPLEWVSGSARGFLRRDDIRNLAFGLPPLAVQRALGDMLQSLDDKIELNRRMNETLEAMARAIFQDWFVTFGPTRAKMEGRPAYLAPDLWSLFPDRLDTEGKPEGWREVPLDQIADFLNGLALQKYPGTDDDDLPVIKIAELRAGVATGNDRASRSIPLQYVVEDGDVLFSWSGSLLQRIWTGGRGALNQHLFKVTSKQWPKWLHYLWVDHHLPNFQAIAASKATTMGHIQRHHLSEAMTVIGSPDVMAAANVLISPLLDRYLANSREARTLATTRDLLLPRLMSGELRVRDFQDNLQRAE
jgi:type I restriction enzyme S subunit